MDIEIGDHTLNYVRNVYDNMNLCQYEPFFEIVTIKIVLIIKIIIVTNQILLNNILDMDVQILLDIHDLILKNIVNNQNNFTLIITDQDVVINVIL